MIKHNGWARAHTNIALIKYWGKENDKFIIPTNDSISLTLNEFYTDTEVIFDSSISKNQLWINDIFISDDKLDRVNNIINYIKVKYDVSGYANIRSSNTVPTSAGLASSSSGMAALAGAAVVAASGQKPNDLTELSRIARLGSGSATRSIFGGIVQWHAGQDHNTSFAERISDAKKLNLNVLTTIINDKPKEILSTYGMKRVSQTSPFFSTWVKESKKDIRDMLMAIQNNDFSKIGELTEKSATMMHATTLTSTPPFTYFEPSSIEVIQLVTKLRKKGLECYYTIDAGPNVKILCQDKNVQEIENNIKNNLLSDIKIIKAKAGPGISFN